VKYKDRVSEAMTWIGKEDGSVFLGEGLINAGRIYNTLGKVSTKRCIEFPICENLIAGSAIGLALYGLRPIIVFQRMDFMLIASDAIINHIALMPQMSGGQITLPIVIRAIIGSRDSKFDVGPQHNHDFTYIFEPYVRTIRLDSKSDIVNEYKEAFKLDEPVLVVEDRDLYEKEV